MIGFRKFGYGIDKRGGLTPEQYLRKYSDFYGVGRSGLEIPDLHGHNAEILVPHISFSSTGYLKRNVALFNNTDSSGFVEAEVYVDRTNILQVFSRTSASNNKTHVLFQILANGKAYVWARNYDVLYSYYQTDEALTVGWHKVKWVSTGTEYAIYVDDILVAGTNGGPASHPGDWFAQVLAVAGNFANISIGAWISNIAAYSTAGKIRWVNYSDKSKWYLTGQGLYEFDSIGGHGMTYIGTASLVYDQLGSTHLLDNGYSVFKKAGQLDEYVPNAVADTPIATPALLATYTKYVDRDGSAVKHNLAPCLIDFDPDETGLLVNYDRSNTTIFEDTARAGSDYDAAHPFRWRAKDIADPIIYYEWLKVGYKDKLLARVTQADLVILTLDGLISMK